MQYDPIKKTLGNFFNRSPILRILFYKLLDLLLLRTWHVKKELRRWQKNRSGSGIGSAVILDAGSGFGQYSYFLSGMDPAWNIEAVDIKEDQIADCRAFFKRAGRKNVLFEKADLTTFAKPGRFDLILSVDVMEHIADDEAVFRNFFDSLSRGGMLLISTPSDQGGSDVHGHGEEESFIDEHVRDGYNREDIREKLKKAGFGRTEARYTYGTPGKIAWRLSMKYPILMLNFSKLLFLFIPFYYLVTFPLSQLLNLLDTSMVHKTGTGLIVKAWK